MTITLSRFSTVVSCSSILALALACGRPNLSSDSKLQDAWNSANRPQIFSNTYQKSFNALPLSGKVAVEPWSDSYWPSYQGGTAARWNAKDTEFTATAWDGKLHSKTEVLAFTPDQLAQLSPAEKFDILRGDYGYALTNYERKSHSPKDDKWWGICHGWAPASVNFKEPGSVVVKNADGIAIPFQSSDVKALLSFQQGRSGRSVLMGERCDADILRNPLASFFPACRDTNAGSFHVVLANQIGLERESFIMDVTRDKEVWNQPVYSFESRKVGERRASLGSARGTLVEYEMETDLTYIVEMDASSSRRVGVYNEKKVARYRYYVEIDASGTIIGGSWISNERPDFLWKNSSADLTGFFAPLKGLYDASVADAPISGPTPVATPLVPVTPTVSPVSFVDAQCPADALLDATLGYCVLTNASGGASAIGNFTFAMSAACEAQGGGSACRKEEGYLLSDGSLVFYQRWALGMARGLRGSGECALGAAPDATSKLCIETSRELDGREVRHAFGPFSDALVAKCVSKGGGPACRSLRWNADFANTISSSL